MSNIRQICTVVVLTLVLASSAIAGDMQAPGITSSGEISLPGETVAGEISTPGVTADMVTEIALGILLNVSSLL